MSIPSHESAFREIFDANHRAIQAYCWRRLPASVADDAAADVFLTAWRKINDAPPADERRLWLYGIARNVVRNANRSSNRRRALANRWSNEPMRHEPGPETIILRNEEEKARIAALERLRAEEREIVLLRAWEVVSAYAVALFSNDCTTYYLLENQLGSDCPTDTRDYEEALSATVEVSNCEPIAVADSEDWNFACRVSYSNALHTAVGAEPATLTAQFYLDPQLKTVTMDDNPGSYPEDRPMLDSFAAFVDDTGLGDSLAEACSINFPERNADCAAFIMQHLADWAAWTASNE